MLHIIQNDPEVPPGNILDSLTIPYFIHHPYRGAPLPQFEDISALIVLGGAMGANDDQKHIFLVELKHLIHQVVKSSKPYLGICLGGQLLAAALGATVVSSRWEELGFSSVNLNDDGNDDPLFKGVEKIFTTFQWHHDSFDIPAGGVLLASSPACPNQAFRVGKSAWGVQFHPEVTETIIRDWCAWEQSTQAGSEEIITEFLQNKGTYLTISGLLIKNFLEVINGKHNFFH